MSCINIKKIGYSKFSDHLHEKYSHDNIPLNVGWEITHRCNLKCSHCYIDPNANKKELNTDEVYSILDKLADAGCLWLLFTGGEPFMRKDFLEIYTYAKKKGFIITIFTNGTLIDEKAVIHLKRYRPFSIEITLYGATKQTYEKITGVPGSFNNCLKGIRLALDKI